MMNPASETSAAIAKPRGYWHDVWRRFRQNRRAVISAVIIAGLFFTGIFTEALAPYCHTKQDLGAVEKAPSLAHPLGTDELGRDLLSRIIWGARTAVIVSVSVVSLNVMIGLFFGSLAGYFGGIVDTVVSRFSDFLMAFPDFLFVLFIAATLRPSIVAGIKALGSEMGLKRALNCGADYVAFGDFFVVIGALAFVGWPGFARLVRSLFLQMREREFVDAARSIGAPDWRIIARHILPNALPAIVVSISLGMGGAIMAETGLSFLGVGLQPPNASWGLLINDNYAFWRTRPWMILVPGMVLTIIVLAYNFLGEGLNEAFNPKT